MHLLLHFSVNAAPRIPNSDSDVLEKLPARARDGRFREVRELRARLTASPNDLALAVHIAGLYFDLAASEGDPRYVGYAEAALGPWWGLASPPVDVLIMRATLRQYRHEFANALQDLEKALERDPQNAQGWAQRAAISMVIARYADARDSCAKLLQLTPEALAVTCVKNVDSLTTGGAMEGKKALEATLRLLPKAASLPVEQRLWIWTRAAEMADRLGDTSRAESLYREALSFGQSDAYLDAAYGDFLLDQGRPAEVLTLLKDKSRSDPLLLRLVLAEKVLNSPAFAEHNAALAARFDAARQRGDKLHLGEEARFTLNILGNAPLAVKIALANWADQREPRDARVVLEAATIAHDRAAAAGVISWYRDNQIASPRLRRLIEGLGD